MPVALQHRLGSLHLRARLLLVQAYVPSKCSATGSIFELPAHDALYLLVECPAFSPSRSSFRQPVHPEPLNGPDCGPTTIYA